MLSIWPSTMSSRPRTHEPLSGLAGLLVLHKENRFHSMDEIVPAMCGRPQIGQLERTVEIADGGQWATSVRVGLLHYNLVWRPGNGGVGASQEAMLCCHRGEHPVEIIDQGLNVGLGASCRCEHRL